MKILMLSWEYPPRIVGGISRVVYDLAQKLGEMGNEVYVVTCWEPGTKEAEKDKFVYVHRVHTYSVNTNNFVDWVLQLNYSILEGAIALVRQTGDFDIIHAHDWIVAFAARVLKHAYKKPLICTIHATEYGRNHGLHNDMQRYISSIEWFLTYESWKVICNSRYMKGELQHVFQIPDDKIVVVHNGVDIAKFDHYRRDRQFRKNYAGDHEKIVFFVGRMVQEKGVQILIDAMPKIISHYNDVKFVLAGKGPQLEYAKGKAANMGLNQKIYFTGYVSDDNLCRLYKCADIAVFPSLYEPFGIVALEGMVAELPVVVTDTGGLGEIVEHKVDGMKAYPGNPDSLADCILEVLLSRNLADTLRRNAIRKVNEMYTWEKISGQMMSAYEEVVQDSRKCDWKGWDLTGMMEDDKTANTRNYYIDIYNDAQRSRPV